MNDNQPNRWTKPVADAVAVIVAAIRPDWQMPGIMTALADPALRELPADKVTIAAVRASADPTVRTPAVIPMDGRHWHPPAAGEPTSTRPQPPPYQRTGPLTEDERRAASAAAAKALAELARIRTHNDDQEPAA